LEHQLFGAQYFEEAGEVLEEQPDLPTMLHHPPSEADTVVQRSLHDPPPVQVITVLAPGERPHEPIPPAPVVVVTEGGGSRTQAPLIAAGGVFAGMSFVAAASVIALGLVAAMVIWFEMRPAPVATVPPIGSPLAPAAPAPVGTPAGTPVVTPAGAPAGTPAAPVAGPAGTPAAEAPAAASGAVAEAPVASGPLVDGIRFPAKFAFDDWQPRDVDTQALMDLVGQLEACPGRIRVTGHTDARGGEMANDRVAVGRAQQVRKILEAQGLDRQRIEIGSAGAQVPEVDGDSIEARAQNRRVTVQCQ
ncbi:MAG: OmpA family protein, partial [Myxococcota bacterium]